MEKCLYFSRERERIVRDDDCNKNRTRGFPRCEIREAGGDKGGGRRKEEEREKGKGEREREGRRWNDVGKEEANQKRKYAPARPEALRESGLRRRSF